MFTSSPSKFQASINAYTRHSVFVNGRSRPVIMENMRSRIARGDIKAERQEAIQVRCFCLLALLSLASPP